ncbi:hypothetical protein [Ruegeria profundi]|uniref:hypothetical protein n=1 Tax=Ruegeria profundi TaxID=1685378 RepID=UPI003C7C619E
MISELGFLPVGRALSDWRKVIDPKFETEAASELLADDHLGPLARSEFEKHKAIDGPKLFFKDVLEFVEFQEKANARSFSEKLFLDQLEQQTLYLFDGDKTMVASPEILDWIDEGSFSEEFWCPELNEIDIHTVHSSTVRKYLSLPVFDGKLFCFIDPYTWTVDTRGIEAIRERVSQVIDPLMLQAWLDKSEIEGDTDNKEDGYYWTAFEKIQHMVKIGEIDDYEDHTLTQASVTQIGYFLEYKLPLLKNMQLSAVTTSSGAGLCVKEAKWTDAIESVKSKTYAELKGRWYDEEKKATSGPTNTVAEEKRIVTEVKFFLSNNEWTGTNSELRKTLGSNLGSRAWRRVIDEVRKDFPEVSVPGRRARKS